MPVAVVDLLERVAVDEQQRAGQAVGEIAKRLAQLGVHRRGVGTDEDDEQEPLVLGNVHIGDARVGVVDRVRGATGAAACGLDISTPAIDAAARTFPDASWIVANADRFLPFPTPSENFSDESRLFCAHGTVR